jgi:hypothetical protein
MDDVDMIERCVEHLYSIGVDHIFALDRASTDGTTERLESIAAGSPLSLLRIAADAVLDTDLAWRVVKEAADRVRPNWMLFLDADEFWMPAGGSIRQTIVPGTADVAHIDRFNVPLTDLGPRLPEALSPDYYDRVLLYVKPIPEFGNRIASDPALVWSQGVPNPKVMVRHRVVVSVDSGNHHAEVAPGARWAAEPVPDLVIAHLPFTTYERFARKVHNIRAAIARYPEFFVGRAGHWRRWAELDEQGKLHEEFDRQRISERELAHLQADGAVVPATELFRSRVGAATEAIEVGTA